MDLELLFSSPFYLHKSRIRSCLRRWFRAQRGQVLDVGCGSGANRSVLGKEARYVGIELNISLRPSVVGSALRLPFSAESFDGVALVEVLEHLPEPREALREAARVLRPGGRLALSTPMAWYLHYEPHDYYRYTQHGLRYLLEQAGFEVKEVVRTGGLWTLLLALAVEAAFHLAYALTVPIRWLTGGDRGRFRLAVALCVPLTFLALGARALLEVREGRFVQGWIILAGKPGAASAVEEPTR